MKAKTFASLILGLVVCISVVSVAADDPVATVAQRNSVSFPDVGKYQVLRGDFHNHTKYSDGRLTPAERMEESWKLGYDTVAISDHGKVEAYKDALPIAQSLGIILIRGLETGFGDAGKGQEHLLALGVSELYEPTQSHRWETQPDPNGGIPFYQKECKRLDRDGGLLVLAHPHVGFRPPVEWAVKHGYVQGVEIKNDVVGKGWKTTESHGTWFYPDAMDWALERGLAVFANTDAHAKREDAHSVTLLFVRERSPKGVLDAIRDARTVAWFSEMLWGPKELLTEFIEDSVDVSVSVDVSGKAWIHFKNRTPALLKAQVLGDGGEPVVLPGNSEVSLATNSNTSPVTIEWKNIWINTKENLTTIHKVK